MVGGRFRCYSESNMDDIGINNSNDKLSLALSEAKISEEDVCSFSSSKKSVSFNEKVQQQYYRWGYEKCDKLCDCNVTCDNYCADIVRHAV